jgi:cytochrome c553
MTLGRCLRLALATLAGGLSVPAPCATPMTDRLLQSISEQRVTTLEGALRLLPTSTRSHFALVFNSRSLQEASFENPRAVLFGNDARFVVTFNGKAGQRGFDTLEIMEFDDRSNRFAFREIQFSGDSTPGQGASVSEANPAKCGACHGQPQRPVWDTFPAWPGAYGEQYRAPLTRPELDGLGAFLKAQPTHPRFQALEAVQVFADPYTFVPGAKVLYAGAEIEPPNAVLSQLLAKLNARMIAHELAAAPRFQTYRYALLGALSRECGPLDSYFTGATGHALGAGAAAFSERSDRATARQLASKALRLQPGVSEVAARSSADVERLDTFRFLVEAFLGLSTAQWTPSLEKETFDFSAQHPFALELDAQLRAIVAASDASLQDLASLRDVGAAPRYCRYLQARSRLLTTGQGIDDDLAAARRRIAARAATPARAQDPARPPEALKTCIACHEGGVGPRLPFADAQQLRARLAADGYPRGTLADEILFRLSPEAGQSRMPLGKLLTDDERSSLARYFSDLASRAAGTDRPADATERPPSGLAE